MYQPLLAWKNFHESAEGQNSFNFSLENFAHPYFPGNVLNPFQRLLASFFLFRRNKYLARVLNINGDLAFFYDFIDNLAARADNFSDFFRFNLQGVYSGSPWR